MKEILNKISSNMDFKIELMEVDGNHIHLLISANPTISPSSIARKLKQESTIEIWNRYGVDLRRHFWKKRVFWTGGYFVSSIGYVSENIVIKYIQNQG